jgi:hypothetical protein
MTTGISLQLHAGVDTWAGTIYVDEIDVRDAPPPDAGAGTGGAGGATAGTGGAGGVTDARPADAASGN